MSNFDTVFTTEEPLDSVVEGSQLSQTVQAQFAGMFSVMFSTSFAYVLQRFLLRRHQHARQPLVISVRFDVCLHI